MKLPFLACAILTGIHVYLGLHVIQRGIIFVDLALAQVAALGATLGMLVGYGLHTTQNYFISLAFTLLGAAAFALTRLRKPLVPQEALVGIVYAVAAAGAILVLSRAPEGSEELQALLVGHLLFVDWPEIAKIFGLYSVIGVLHWMVRKPLLLISHNPERAFQEGRHVRWWDFVFYATFGVVVTSSVDLAGVLLVFSFLIVPSVCAVFLARGVGARLFVGWFCGIMTSVAGIIASYQWDLPTGATVVCAFGICLIVCAGLRLGLGERT
ncbi:MAG: metal ABC transporter permease [Candidatus Hydrogenedentes bacterium]|nr:metal ABC transporter permease [Candidatus Hydrogenedentota bacterium]